MLYIIATPIGNLSDITVRALDVLRSVDVIACEDTRHTSKLLNHYQIKKRLVSYYEYNKLTRGQELLRILQEGRDVALVADSGTPGISDPGFHLVNLAFEHSIPVSPIPGACALVAALSISGIPADRFIFEGFLPQKNGPRMKKLKELCGLKKTIVLYESPHRFLRLLGQIRDVAGDRRVTVAREITKKFEEIKSGTAIELLKHFDRERIRGEFVVIVNNRLKRSRDENSEGQL